MTLTQLLVVLAVVGILSGLVLASVNRNPVTAPIMMSEEEYKAALEERSGISTEVRNAHERACIDAGYTDYPEHKDKKIFYDEAEYSILTRLDVDAGTCDLNVCSVTPERQGEQSYVPEKLSCNNLPDLHFKLKTPVTATST